MFLHEHQIIDRSTGGLRRTAVQSCDKNPEDAPRAGMLNSKVPTLAATLLHDVSSWSASTSVPASASACTVGRRTGRDQTPVSLSASAPPSASSGSATSSRAIVLTLALRNGLSQSQPGHCTRSWLALGCALSARLPGQARDMLADLNAMNLLAAAADSRTRAT